MIAILRVSERVKIEDQTCFELLHRCPNCSHEQTPHLFSNDLDLARIGLMHDDAPVKVDETMIGDIFGITQEAPQ